MRGGWELREYVDADGSEGRLGRVWVRDSRWGDLFRSERGIEVVDDEESSRRWRWWVKSRTERQEDRPLLGARP